MKNKFQVSLNSKCLAGRDGRWNVSHREGVLAGRSSTYCGVVSLLTTQLWSLVTRFAGNKLENKN